MADKKYIDGMIVKPPHDNAPDWIIAKVSIKREEMIAWLQQQTGDWINADLKESQGGKYYVEVDEWKPDQQRTQRQERAPAQQRTQAPRQQQQQQAPDDDDIPF